MRIAIIVDETGYSISLVQNVISAVSGYDPKSIEVLFIYVSKDLLHQGTPEGNVFKEIANEKEIVSEIFPIKFSTEYDDPSQVSDTIYKLIKELGIGVIFTGDHNDGLIDALDSLRKHKLDVEVIESYPLVKDLMTKNVVSIPSNVPVQDAAHLMLKTRAGSIIVLKNNSPAGIVTSTDLISKIIAYNVDPKNLIVSDVMSHPLITVDEHTDVLTAAGIMNEEKIKKLPVISRGAKDRLVGIVTASDLADKADEKTLKATDMKNLNMLVKKKNM